MAKKRSRHASRKRARPADRWGAYLVVATLLLLGVTVAASPVLWASATLEPAVSDALSAVPLPANAEVVGNVPGGDDGARTLNLYGGGMRPLVEERDGVQTLNIYGPGGRIIAQVVRDGQGSEEVRYLLTDHLGSTRVVVDAEGNAMARYEYAPHGETTVAGSKGAEVRYRYTGHPYDEGQELYETPARGYDPTLGRFLSVDPRRQDASPYVYTGNNPVGYVDPTGGIKVPFFVISGLPVNKSNQGGALSRSIARGFRMRDDQIVRPSNIFMGIIDSRGHKRPSSAEVNPRKYLSGGREEDGTKWSLNNKLYWFIGEDEPVTVPNEIEAGLEAMRKIQPGFADEIVVIDFTGDANLSAPIMTKLSGLAKSVRLVRAGLETVPNFRGIPVTETITHDIHQYTPHKFGNLVDTTYQLDDVTQLVLTPLIVPDATRGESTQFDVPTVIQRVEQDTEDSSRPRSPINPSPQATEELHESIPGSSLQNPNAMLLGSREEELMSLVNEIPIELWGR